MEYLDTGTLVKKEPGQSFRGPHRIMARRGSITGRRYWMRKYSKQPRAYDPEKLVGIELAYAGLVPRVSSFQSVTEACLLNAPRLDEEDVRSQNPYFLKHQKDKTVWGDPNYGKPITTKGKKAFHGDGCDCIKCNPEKERCVLCEMVTSNCKCYQTLQKARPHRNGESEACWQCVENTKAFMEGG